LEQNGRRYADARIRRAERKIIQKPWWWATVFCFIWSR